MENNSYLKKLKVVVRQYETACKDPNAIMYNRHVLDDDTKYLLDEGYITASHDGYNEKNFIVTFYKPTDKGLNEINGFSTQSVSPDDASVDFADEDCEIKDTINHVEGIVVLDFDAVIYQINQILFQHRHRISIRWHEPDKWRYFIEKKLLFKMGDSLDEYRVLNKELYESSTPDECLVLDLIHGRWITFFEVWPIPTTGRIKQHNYVPLEAWVTSK